MDIKIKNIGNSKGIIIPAQILKGLNIDDKDELELVLKNKQIIIYKKESKTVKSLADLFHGYKGEYNYEIIFKDDKGKEKW